MLHWDLLSIQENFAVHQVMRLGMWFSQPIHTVLHFPSKISFTGPWIPFHWPCGGCSAGHVTPSTEKSFFAVNSFLFFLTVLCSRSCQACCTNLPHTFLPTGYVFLGGEVAGFPTKNKLW